MSVFQFSSYRTFLKNYISNLPKGGRGELSKMSERLGVHSTLLSLVLNGSRDLSQEQAYDMAQYLELAPVEAEYFYTLVQYERASHQQYRGYLKGKLEKIKSEGTKVSTKFEHERKLSETESAIFYSSWIYSAIRLYASVGDGITIEEFSTRFGLPRPKTVEALNFLASAGLVEEKKGKYKMGSQRTFLDFGSPFLTKHQANWRIKAIQHSDRLQENELMFTCPFSITKADFEKVREIMASAIKSFSQLMSEGDAEDVACLNIDLFWVGK